MLRIKGLAKRYQTGDLALKGIDFDLPDGQVMALIGPSGAGKSTVIRCINRLVEPTAGTVTLNHTVITGLGRGELRRARRRMGMIFQEYALVGRLTVIRTFPKEELLQAMPPWQGGGDMILTVGIQASTWNSLPWKFEAGTPNMSGAVGLGAAIDYVTMLGRERIAAHEQALLAHATELLAQVPGLRFIGTAAHKAGVISFVLEGIHPHDIGTILDREGVAIRTGHHCAMPVMDWFGVPATARASFGCYSTEADIAALLAGIERVREVFA